MAKLESTQLKNHRCWPYPTDPLRCIQAPRLSGSIRSINSCNFCCFSPGGMESMTCGKWGNSPFCGTPFLRTSVRHQCTRGILFLKKKCTEFGLSQTKSYIKLKEKVPVTTPKLRIQVYLDNFNLNLKRNPQKSWNFQLQKSSHKSSNVWGVPCQFCRGYIT